MQCVISHLWVIPKKKHVSRAIMFTDLNTAIGTHYIIVRPVAWSPGGRGCLTWLVRWRRRQRRRCRSWCSITRRLYSISTVTVLSPATAGMGNDTFWGFHNDLCSPWIHHCLLSFLASAIHKSAIHKFSNSPIWINIECYGNGCYSKQ